MTLGFFEAWKVILHIKKGWGGLDNRPLICYHTLRAYPLEGCSPAEPSSVSDRAAKIRFISLINHPVLMVFTSCHQPFLATLPSKKPDENFARLF
jgi:hypothetical protein